MNLQPITGKPFWFTCCVCGSKTHHELELGLACADLDGVPFQSYYCAACALAAERTQALAGARKQCSRPA